MFVLRLPGLALRWVCLLAVVLSLLPANPVQATVVRSSKPPQAVARQVAEPVATDDTEPPAGTPALPRLPVAVTLSADPGVLAPGAPAVVTLRIEATAQATDTLLPPIDVTFTLPDGLLTADGRTGTLTWYGVPVGADTPFEQALTVGVAPGNAAAGGQAVLRITATAVAAGYAASAGETLIGVGSNAPATAAQADGDGAVVQSSDGEVAVLAPGGVLPAGASLQFTELFNGEAAALEQPGLALTPADRGSAVATAVALTETAPAVTPAANAWLFFPIVGGHGDANPPADQIEQTPPTEQTPPAPHDAGPSMFGELSASAVSIATRQDANLQAFRLFQLDATTLGVEPDFAGEVLLRVSLAPWLSRGVNPAMLRLWTREQPGASWQPVPTGYVEEQQTLEAWLPHFSQFGLGAGLDTSGDSLPSVKAFTVDALNGGASLHLPIATPKGLGGLSPSLSFDYSSVGMDDLLREAGEREVRAQASSVGSGWSLGGVSYIARADGVADKADAAKEFALVLNGTRTSIVYQGGRWRTNPETFARVVWQGAAQGHDNSAGYKAEDYYGWSVFTPDGLRYDFGDDQVFPGTFKDDRPTATFLAKSNNGIEDRRLAKRWYLRRVTDPLGNTMEYRYRGEMAEEFYGVGVTWKGSGRAWYTRTIDPTEIYWNANPTYTAEEVFNLLWPDTGAVALGFAGSAGMGVDIVGSIGLLYLDHQGNVVFGGTSAGAGGNTGANADVVAYLTLIPMASSVDVFDGTTVNAGLSGGAGPGAGIEFNATKDSETGKTVIGVTGTVGASAKLNIPVAPLEFYSNVTNTSLGPWRVNVFDAVGLPRPE